MLSGPARESLGFALRRRMLELYAVVLLGLLVRGLGAAFEILPHAIAEALDVLVGLAGGLLVVSGVVGIVHRVLLDAERVSRQDEDRAGGG